MAERVTIKELVVKLLFEGSESGVTKFNSALQAFRTVATYAQDAARMLADTVGAVTLQIADQADALDEAAQQVGITASAYDSLAASLELNGATVGHLDAGLRTLTGTVEEFVRTGKGAGADAFKTLLGPNARERLRDVESVDQALALLADGLAAVEDPMLQLALANDVLGKSGGKLLPTLKGGSAGLREQAEAMKVIGVFTPELIAAGSRLNDGLAGLALRARGVKLAFGEETVPALADLVTELNAGADALREMLSPVLRAGARLMADGFRTLRDGLRSLREQVLGSERAVAFLKTGMIFLMAVAGILVAQALPGLVLWLGRAGLAAARAGAQMLLAWAKAALPLVLLAGLITAIVLVLDDLITYVNGGDSAFGRLLDRMKATNPALAAMAERLRFIFGGGLGEALFDAFDALRSKSQEIIDSVKAGVLAIPEAMRAALASLGDAVPDVLKSLGRGLGAVPGAFMQAGQALTGGSGGRTNNVSMGGSSVNVSVNGAGDPRAVGAEVARQVDAAVSRHSTQAARDLGSAMSY